MDFTINDFVEEVQERIRKYRDCVEDEVVATMIRFSDTENAPSVAGEWNIIQKMIPTLQELGYDELHLKYEDCGIWVLEWADSELSGLRWMLVE